ncbi:MAG: alpha/beta hydrolase [Anaerobiospirillum succiniciproducens]|uniref:alpha/beta hydrolase n=1 Tax=Anaerobiospirillum succiniciproducens TaxID=13335 RepID=UPI002353378B|nr:alpha/beta hydrolase [Anaerobiospirillum succiniciproducens]MCI6863746.1 alpha/beta hydrolase [Anaerobiospirillum succiniciproducens]MDO4675746.1 alpha/beta hydrolase [Anaerobiospirillum succiniciproducens]MDY2798325.1 alpha/beta hydrolase [Anaerobiospirillum succiniciproducens]
MSDSTNNDVNLSEILFKPKHDYIETSLISNSGCPLPDIGDGLHMMGSHFRSLWYRPINRYTWTYLGANCLDVDLALSNIVMSKNPRTRAECFDTIEQYGPGNWIYEFSSIAQKRVMQARLCEESGNLEQASHEYRMASRYFAIASYPNLKGDVLAAQASLLGRKAYRKIFNEVSRTGHYQEEEFTFKGEKISGYLHCVDTKKLQPCVVVVATYESTSTDYYRLFKDYLRKMGIALFIIDMPGMGSAQKLVLDEQSSDLVEAAIEHLQKLKFIDTTAIGLYGYRFSANAAARLTLLRPDLVKALALVSPAIHSAYLNQKVLNSMSLATRSSLANRLNADASNWSVIVPQLQTLSLKVQGLIGYHASNKTPTLSIYTPVDLKYNDDRDMVSKAFSNNHDIVFKQMRVSEFVPRIFTEISEFFRKNLLS